MNLAKGREVVLRHLNETRKNNLQVVIKYGDIIPVVFWHIYLPLFVQTEKQEEANELVKSTVICFVYSKGDKRVSQLAGLHLWICIKARPLCNL
jgi:hypothetical protein